MSYGNIAFEDCRVELDDWPTFKPECPFGQMPVLEINNVKYHQSLAIVRYLAKKCKLYGKDDEQALRIDIIADTFNDLRQKIGRYYYESDEKYKEQLKAPLFSETIPFYLEKLDAIVKENNGYFVDGELSYADLYFVSLLHYINFMIGGNLINNYPNLESLEKTVHNIPAIKTWIEKRPKTDR